MLLINTYLYSKNIDFVRMLIVLCTIVDSAQSCNFLMLVNVVLKLHCIAYDQLFVIRHNW